MCVLFSGNGLVPSGNNIDSFLGCHRASLDHNELKRGILIALESLQIPGLGSLLLTWINSNPNMDK